MSRDRAVRKLVGLITRRSLVQIQLPQPRELALNGLFLFGLYRSGNGDITLVREWFRINSRNQKSKSWHSSNFFLLLRVISKWQRRYNLGSGGGIVQLPQPLQIKVYSDFQTSLIYLLTPILTPIKGGIKGLCYSLVLSKKTRIFPSFFIYDCLTE